MIFMVRAILVWVPSAGIGGHGLRPLAKQFIFDFDHHLVNGLGKYRIDPHVQSFRGLALLLVSFSFIFPVDELGGLSSGRQPLWILYSSNFECFSVMQMRSLRG